MARYHFVTTFELAASREQAWPVLRDPSGWPTWWRWLRRVDVLAEGDQDGVGSRYRYAFRTALPYTLSFEAETVRAERESYLEARASGELAGSGLWQLLDAEGGVRVQYDWIVETTKRWMNVVAPVARPAFSWNHDVLMRDFARGFADQFGAQPVSLDNRTIRPASPEFGRLPGPASS